MQIYSDGKNRVIKGSFPKRFKLKNAGVDVPFLRTAKDSIRLSGEIPVGNLDIEEVINEMTPTPAKLETPSFAIINRSDFDKIDILNKKLAINQSQMNVHLSALTEHEATLANLETQNAKAIDETKSIITEVAKAVGKEIQADRESLIKVSESFTSSLNETGKILSNKIDTHEKAKNPHKITKATIGLERVDNTSDEDKPISKAVKKVLDEKADKTEIEDVKKDLKEAVKKQDRIEKGLDRMNIIGGVSGNELPYGGKKGQVLSKFSNKTGDYTWVDPVSGLKIVRVDALPVSGETGTLYLVPSNNTETSNIYDEYIWADNGTGSYSWEKIGSTEVDLSGYVTSVNNVQPDANGNVTINAGATYTAGTGIDITNNEISVTSPTLVNTATNIYNGIAIGNRGLSGGSSISIGNNTPYGSDTTSYSSVIIGNSTKSGGGSNVLIGYDTQITYNYEKAVCIGSGSKLQNSGEIAIGYEVLNSGLYSIGIGYQAKGQASHAIAIGRGATARGDHSIQIGYGTNTEASTFCVGFNNTNYKLLDGTTGKIPDGRLPIATSASSSSTNTEVVGAKLFYDTCGDIETLINAL